jgi:protein involved in polysaccharide export with SLBB domain
VDTLRRGKGVKLGGRLGCVRCRLLLAEIMGKRSGVAFAILVIASVGQIQLPVATAQTSGSDTFDCPSGIISSVDGSCVSEEEAPTQGLGLGTYGQNGTSANGAYGGTAGAGGASLGGQYPGLQSSGMNTRVQSIIDQGGLANTPAQLEALEQSRLLALRPPSAPTDFQLLVRSSLGTMLPVYGDSLFRSVPSTFAPLREVNVTPDYVLGPGDQLIIRIWGQVNFNAQLTVDRTGSVYLPQVGEIHVAGLTYAQVRQHIHDAVAHIYKSFDLNVEMGQLRSIQVFVVGQARRPGTYTLGSLSTLVTALFATGGPSVQGSLRDIQLRRNGQTIAHLDLYDLLIFGDMSKDAALLPGDVIYIPPVGPQVAIAGDVHVPAIYEVKGETTVDQALRFAGGLSSTASLERASLERVDAHKERTVLDISLEKTAAGLATPLQPADILRVLPISPEFQNTVTLRGNVAEPGRFSWHPGMKLSDIIPDSQSLITRDYWQRRNQLGVPGPDFKPEYANNPDFYPRDIYGYQTGTAQYDVNGVPLYNGQRANNGAQQGQTTPTGTNQNIGQSQSQNQSQSQSQNSSQPYDPNCDPGIVNNPQQNQGGQYSRSTGSPLANGVQSGQPCSTPASQSLADEERTSSGNLPRPLLNIALPVPEIDWSYAVIERMNPQTLTTSLVPFNPGKLVLDHDSAQNLTLEPGDVVTIFSQADIRVPQEQRTKFVRLEGEFKQAGIYTVLPGETLQELVARAGGFTPEAYLFGSNFTRESTRILQQLRLDDYLQNLELEIDRSTIAASASIGTVDPAATAASRSLVARFRTIRATGRVVLDIPQNATGVNSLPNIQLEDGDRFVVPSKPSTVNVVGAVYDQNSFLFRRSQEVGSYLRLAGGPTKSADGRDAFIIRADGSVVSRQSQKGVFGNTFTSTHLNAGDTVVIPEKVPHPSGLRNFVQYTQIFSQLAFGAAAIAVLQ